MSFLDIYATRQHSRSTHLVLNRCLLVFIQMHFDHLRSVQHHTNALADNFRWEDEIVEHVFVDSCQRAAAWALLFIHVGAAAKWLGQDLAFSTEHKVTTGELLLQLTHQANLNLLERLLLRNWDEDDDSLGGFVRKLIRNSRKIGWNSLSCCRVQPRGHG